MNRDYQSFVEEASNYPDILNEYKKTGKIFTDNNFYQNDLFKKRDFDKFGDMKYIRLDEMYKAPLFDQDAINQNYITQGGIGDCYMLAAYSRVAVNPYSIKSLFETEHPNLILGEVKDSFNIECGAVVVYFRAYGRITPILIDTLMPYQNGNLRFSRPVDINKSAWFCLIEKAYAKLIGCYADIIGGNLPLAIYSMYNLYYPKFITFKKLVKSDDELFAKIIKYYRKHAVMGTSIDLKDNVYNVTEEDLNDKGLVSNHCYTLLKVKELNKLRLFCLRNPWGCKEWNGDYSDKSPLWDKNPDLKKKCKWEDKEDGTFWMCDKDYFKYFTDVNVSLPIPGEWHVRGFDYHFDPRNDKENNEEFQFKITDSIGQDTVCRFYIMIEKKHQYYDFKNNKECKNIKFSVNFTHINGKKIEQFDSVTSSSNLITISHKIKGKNDIVNFHFTRIDKCDIIENCYIYVFSEHNFDLHDIKYPKYNFLRENNEGPVFFNNSAYHHDGVYMPGIVVANSNIAIGKIDSMEITDKAAHLEKLKEQMLFIQEIKKINDKILNEQKDKQKMQREFLKILENKNKEIEKLTREKEELTESINNLEIKYKKEWRKKDNETKKLKEENEKLSKKNIENEIKHNTNLEKKDKEINDLKVEIEKLSKINIENENEYNTNLEKKGKEINNLKVEIEKLSKINIENENEYNTNLEKKDKEINNLKEEIEKLSKINIANENKHNTNLEKKDKEISDLKEEIEKLSKINIENENEYNTKLEKKDKEINNLKKEISKIAETYNEKRNEHRKEIEDKTQKINQITNEKNELNAKLNKLIKENEEELKKQKFILDRERQNQLNDKTQQINDLKDKIESLDKHAHEKEEEHIAEINYKNFEILQIKKEKDNIETQMKKLRKESKEALQKKDEEKNEMSYSIEQLEQKIIYIEYEKENLQNYIQKKNKLLQFKDNQIHQLKQKQREEKGDHTMQNDYQNLLKQNRIDYASSSSSIKSEKSDSTSRDIDDETFCSLSSSDSGIICQLGISNYNTKENENTQNYPPVNPQPPRTQSPRRIFKPKNK